VKAERMKREEKTMNKRFILLLVAVLLAGTAAGFALAHAIPNGANNAADDELTVYVPEEENVADDAITDDAIIDDGSDIIFDDTEIVLPGEGEDYNMDTTIPHYFSVTGNVVSVEKIEGLIHVTIEDTDGNPAVLVLSEETVFPFSDEIKEGDEVTGWYQTDRPMIMIWPPQYNIAVLVTGAPEGVNIKVDRFHAWKDNTEGFLLSQDEMFAFKTDENTEIILASGESFPADEIEGRRIVVIYGISTRSIPEMATADKLIVLYEDIMAFG